MNERAQLWQHLPGFAKRIFASGDAPGVIKSGWWSAAVLEASRSIETLEQQSLPR